MSIKTYQKAKKIILKNKDLADFEGQKSGELIAKAEAAVGLKFTGSYLDYLQTFGAGNFGSEEVYGIIDEDFEDSSVPDAIWYTLNLRKSINLPANFLAMYYTGSDEVFCLDFNSTKATGESKVVALDSTYALEDQTLETIANDFGDFLLELVEEELE